VLNNQESKYVIIPLILDIAGTILAIVAAQELRQQLDFGREILADIGFFPEIIFVLSPLIWAMVAFTIEVYNPSHSYSFLQEARRVVIGVLAALLVLAGVLYFSYRNVSRLLVIYYFVLQLLILLGWRLGLQSLGLFMRDKNHAVRRVLVIGNNELGQQVATAIQKTSNSGLEFAGFVDNLLPDDKSPPDIVLGSFNELAAIVSENSIEEVIVALPEQSYQQINHVVASLQMLPVQVRIVPSYLSLALHRATVEEFGGLLLINLRAPALNNYQRLVKRSFDLLIGSVLLVVSLPLMVGIAIGVWLSSPGPVIFKQARVGENGRIFTMYKFRSMVPHTEVQRSAQFATEPLTNIVHKFEEDPHTTRIGRFLRRTSLDELPQLVNVFKGDMSLVGPRPEMPWLVEKYEAWQLKRFAVPQGITGWWQINGRSNKLMHLHTEDDLYYIQNYSIFLDIQILLKTVLVVFRRDGAF